MHFGPRLDRERPLQRVDRVPGPIDALQQQPQVVERERVIRAQRDDAPERLHRFVDVLLRLRQAEREQPLDRSRARQSRAPARAPTASRPRPALTSASVRLLSATTKSGRAANARLIGVDRRIERADTIERLAKPVLHVRIARRRPRRLPEQHERGGIVPLLFELEGAGVGGFGVLRLCGREQQEQGRTDGSTRRFCHLLLVCFAGPPPPLKLWGPTPALPAPRFARRRWLAASSCLD